MKVVYMNKSLRYSLEDKLYQNKGVLDDADVNQLTSGTNYEIDFNAYQFLNDADYKRNINIMLDNFNSMFRLQEFMWSDILGGMWVFTKI